MSSFIRGPPLFPLVITVTLTRACAWGSVAFAEAARYEVLYEEHQRHSRKNDAVEIVDLNSYEKENLYVEKLVHSGRKRCQKVRQV